MGCVLLVLAVHVRAGPGHRVEASPVHTHPARGAEERGTHPDAVPVSLRPVQVLLIGT